MRALIFELRPESLQNEGLVSALTKQSDALHARHKLEITTSFCPEPEISLDLKEMLYRIAQESLQNIAKHASATKVELSLQESDRQLILEIRDNGKGFNPQENFPVISACSPCGNGRKIWEVSLQIRSKPGEGTSIQVRLDINPGETEPQIQAKYS